LRQLNDYISIRQKNTNNKISRDSQSNKISNEEINDLNKNKGKILYNNTPDSNKLIQNEGQSNIINYPENIKELQNTQNIKPIDNKNYKKSLDMNDLDLYSMNLRNRGSLNLKDSSKQKPGTNLKSNFSESEPLILNHHSISLNFGQKIGQNNKNDSQLVNTQNIGNPSYSKLIIPSDETFENNNFTFNHEVTPKGIGIVSNNIE